MTEEWIYLFYRCRKCGNEFKVSFRYDVDLKRKSDQEVLKEYSIFPHHPCEKNMNKVGVGDLLCFVIKEIGQRDR